MNIEFGLCADELSKQLEEFNFPAEKVAIWQGIADFILTASISHAIGDKQVVKLNSLLGHMIVEEVKKVIE